MINLCYLGLGSNLKCPKRQLTQAVKALKTLPYTHLLEVSSPYFSKALGRSFQPNYINLVVALKTRLSPHQLLDFCFLIEKKQGRVRKKRWASRPLDIDILLYRDLRLNSPKLNLPHPEMLNRDFVVSPLNEIRQSI